MPPTPPHIAPVLARAGAAFRTRFGRGHQWAAAAPGRVNLIGEHTDYNGGFVLPIAIDRVCVAVGAMAADTAVSHVYTADLDRLGTLDMRAPLRAGGPGIERGTWLSYVAGVIAQFQRDAAAPLPNLDIAIASSVPVGSGLSSSAAIEVATATLLEQALSLPLAPKAKALLCQRAEHELAGVPCGIMDQFISTMGRQGHALLIDCRSEETALVPIPADAAVVLLDSGVRHALAGGEYAGRRATCAAAAAKLGVPQLRDASIRALSAGEGLLTPEEHRRARHVITENARTLAAAEALRRGDLPTVGQLMRESHASLRDDYEVSCPELDSIADVLCGIQGVYGARMTGGGFGGHAVALCQRRAVQRLLSAIPGAVEVNPQGCASAF